MALNIRNVPWPISRERQGVGETLLSNSVKFRIYSNKNNTKNNLPQRRHRRQILVVDHNRNVKKSQMWTRLRTNH